MKFRWQRFRFWLSDRLLWASHAIRPPVLTLRIGSTGENLSRDKLPGLPRPDLWTGELLVYMDCRCGWRMAAPEGNLWPRCPNCGRQVKPPMVDGTKPQDGQPVRLGYVAMLMPERDAVDAIQKVSR
jgi:hypothetical protein